MSNNGNEQPKLSIVCPACQQHFSARLPELEISNALFCSIVTATHEKLVKCLCGQAFVLIINAAQAGWTAAPVGEDVVQKAEGSRIIIPDLKLV